MEAGLGLGSRKSHLPHKGSGFTYPCLGLVKSLISSGFVFLQVGTHFVIR